MEILAVEDFKARGYRGGRTVDRLFIHSLFDMGLKIFTPSKNEEIRDRRGWITSPYSSCKVKS